MSKNRAVIVGGGVAGPLLALYLAKQGLEVHLYEKRSDSRKDVQTFSGRSINLVLSSRGIYALNELGLFDDLAKCIIPIKGRVIHTKDGQQHYIPYANEETPPVYSIMRSVLSHYLLNCAENCPNVTLHFDQKCLDVDFRSNKVWFEDTKTKRKYQIPLKLLFATDGIASNVRKSLIRLPKYNYSQEYHAHAYKEILLPAGHNQTYQIEKFGFHVWPKGDYMFQAQANLDGSFTCSLFLPYSGEPSFESLTTANQIESFFKEHFPDVPPLIPDLTKQFLEHDIGYFVTIKQFPWRYKHQLITLGDAAHAIGPYYGQGMNSSFEDCTVLNQCIEKYKWDWEKIFIEFEKRKMDTDVIAALERENFLELRDRTQDPKFILKRNLELALEKAYPDQFLSKYSMVVMKRIPYSIAGARGRIQDRILEELCLHATSLADFDLYKVKSTIDKELGKLPANP